MRWPWSAADDVSPRAGSGSGAAASASGDAPPASLPGDEEKAAAALAAVVPPTLWLLGKTGAGKSTIVQELTGAEAAEVGDGFRPCTTTSARYDFPDDQLPVLRFLDTRGLGEVGYDPTDDLAAFGDQTHLVLVVVRVADQAVGELLKELRTIRKAAGERPMLLVLTCLHEVRGDVSTDDTFDESPRPLPTDTPENAELRRLLAAQYERFAGLFEAAVPLDITPVEYAMPSRDFGAERLRRAVLRLMPQAQRQAAGLALAAIEEGGLSREEHQHIIYYATAAAAAAATPVPWLDVPVVAGLQWRLTYARAKAHDQSLDRTAVARMSGLIGTRAVAGLFLRDLLKVIPWVGSALNATAAFTTTYAAGRAAEAYFAARKRHPDHAPNAAELKRIYRHHLQRAMTLWNQTEELGDPAAEIGQPPP